MKFPKPSLDTLDEWLSFLFAMALQAIAAVLLFLSI